jgi:hypothetical protein
MESMLHRELKELAACGGEVEAVRCGYRIDAVTPSGEYVEIQTQAPGRIRRKLGALVEVGRVRLVIPLVVRKKLWWREGRGRGRLVEGRYSSKRGKRVEVFDELVGLGRLLGDRRLVVEVWEVEVREERRRDRRRRWGYRVLARGLSGLAARVELAGAADYWGFLGVDMEGAFTTRELSGVLGEPLWVAQKVAYCLRHAGAARAVGKRGRYELYEAAAGDEKILERACHA